MPCQETYICSGIGDGPIEMTWTASSGPVSGYNLYHTPGTVSFCPTTWTATGPTTLLNSFTPTQLSWTGAVPSMGGELSIIAFNDAGLSEPTYSNPVDLTENVTCP